jgi:hypothetical protein
MRGIEMNRSRYLPVTLPKTVFILILAFGIVGTSQVSVFAAPLVFGAGAYGTYAVVGTTVKLTGTAAVGLPACSSQAGATASNTVASVNALPIVTTGAVDTSVGTTTTSADATASIASLNLLGGLISASAVKAVSTTSRVANSFKLSAAGSSFSSLLVDGMPMSNNVAPNTTLSLAGFGKVVLNEQTTVTGASSARLVVNMIHVFITGANVLKIAAGTQIIVASAQSFLLVPPGPASVSGGSYGSIVAGGLLQSGATAPISLPCLGTDGAILTNSLASVSIPKVLSSGVITDTAQGVITPLQASGTTTSTIKSLNLLGGIVTVGTIKGVAHASSSGGALVAVDDTGSSFVGLKVTGHPEITDAVAPNTSIALSGFGTLFLHRVIKTATSIDVRMIELVINHSNALGIPLGADVIVARPYAVIPSAGH